MGKIIEQVKNFVEEECKKPTSKYGFDPFLFHFVPVRNYAVKLAEKKGADVEIVEVAAWLHDIGSIMFGRKDHHVTGAEIAEKKLRELGFAEDKIKKVKHCILVHRGSQKFNAETVEAKCLIEADAMSSFEDLSGLFQCAFAYEKLSRLGGKKSVIGKLETKWNQLSENTKELIKPKYEAVMLLLR